MAIEQYGESILAGVRSRQEQDRKRREKEQLQAALTGLGVTIGYKVGNEVLANNMSNFLNNENIFAAKAQYKAALNNQASLFGLQKEIESSGLSTTDFFATKMRPQFEARAKEIVPFDRVGPAGAYDEMVTAEVRKMAEQQAAAYNKALEAANNLSSEEDFANMIALNAKEAKATNILDAATRSIGRFFTGRSAQDVEEEAFNAIINGRMSQNAEKMSIFMEEYDRTKDLVSAFDFANFVVPEVSEEERLIKSTKTEYSEIGDKVYKRVTVTTQDRNTGKVDQFEEKPEVATEFDDPKEVEQTILKQYMSTFNLAKDTRAALTPEGYRQFIQKVYEATEPPLERLNIIAPQSRDDYIKMSTIFLDFVTNNPQFQKDPALEQRLNTVIGEIIKHSSVADILIPLLGADSPEQRKAARSDMISSFAPLMLLQRTDIESTTPYGTQRK